MQTPKFSRSIIFTSFTSIAALTAFLSNFHNVCNWLHICSTDLTPLVQSHSRLETSSLTIGIVSSKPNRYEALKSYLEAYFAGQVKVTIDAPPYETSTSKLATKEWDVAFTYSPMIAIAAEDNDYIGIARMFPKYPPYLKAALYTTKESPIDSIDDIGPSTVVALGSIESASSFYMPMYSLYGKTFTAEMGHSNSEIVKLINKGDADVGAGNYDKIKANPNFKILYVSPDIPGAGVYLSPKLSEADRKLIEAALREAPQQTKDESNYGEGKIPNHDEFRKIRLRTEDVLQCTNFSRNPVQLFCNKPGASVAKTKAELPTKFIGTINGYTIKSNNLVQLRVVTKANGIYYVLISRTLLDAKSGNPIALVAEKKRVVVTGTNAKKVSGGAIEVRITSADQLELN